MATSITMPQLGESVSEGTIGRWLKQEGETVKKDESICEIVTDKVTAELPSPVAGTLTKILVGDDQTVKIGTAIAEVDESGGAGTGTSAGGSAVTGTTSSDAQATALSTSPSSASGPSGTSNVSADVAQASWGNGTGGDSASASHMVAENGTRTYTATLPREDHAEKVSPLARRMAQEHGIDLGRVHGTGDGGRVRKEDILAYLDQTTASPVPTAPAPTTQAPTAAGPNAQPAASLPTAPANGQRATSLAPAAAPVTARIAPLDGDEIVTPTPARRVIAEHMVRSKHTAPHATTLVEVDMTSLASWLARNKDEFKRREGVGISYQTFAIKAAVAALREHPYMNASWTEDDKIILHKRVNIGVSVALDGNLMVPVVRDAETLSIAGIARAVSDLVARARARKLMPDELQGATFTVNNPGVFGTLISMAIINQPNAGILTMDAVEKRPVVVGDAIAIRQMMYMSLSFDHRVIDGLTAAQFLGAVKRRLEGFGPEIDC